MNKLETIVNNHYSHYHHKKYWRLKFKLYNDKTTKLHKMIILAFLKKEDAFNCASLGHRLDGGSKFKNPPHLPHGIKGIFITDYASLGENVTILQQVTIGSKMPGDHSGPKIGNNVFIGAGAKIIGDIVIEDNVKIGANCVVVENIPKNSTVVQNHNRIIRKED